MFISFRNSRGAGALTYRSKIPWVSQLTFGIDWYISHGFENRIHWLLIIASEMFIPNFITISLGAYVSTAQGNEVKLKRADFYSSSIFR